MCRAEIQRGRGGERHEQATRAQARLRFESATPAFHCARLSSLAIDERTDWHCSDSFCSRVSLNCFTSWVSLSSSESCSELSVRISPIFGPFAKISSSSPTLIW